MDGSAPNVNLEYRKDKMITADQLKDVMERAEALHHYLNIDQKQMELEE